MFKINQSASFFWPVTVNIPGDGGKFEKHTFDAEFKRVSQSEILAMHEDIKADKTTDRSFCEQVLVGWKGITEDGQEVPFTPTTMAAVLDIPSVAASIVLAFQAAHSGVARKN